jgi:hypothetical protein
LVQQEQFVKIQHLTFQGILKSIKLVIYKLVKPEK